MYLGRNPAVGTQRMLDSLELQFNGTLTTFDLRYGGIPIYPTLSESLIVSLGGVLQEPGEAFYVSSDRIVFSEAPSAGTECWILLYSQYGASVTSSTSSPVIQATGEPMGFENRTHSSISFDNATRTFSIAPNTAGGHSSYVVWTKGTRRVVSTTQSVQVGTSTGLYYIYFDANGDIQYKTTYFTWDTETMVAYVYWNSATSSAPFVADERHGVVLDWQTHEYLHRTRGAVIAEGFSISAYTTTGNGSADAHAQFDMGNGTFFDEDLEVNITHSATPTVGTFTQVLTGGAEIPVFYMSGSSGAWVRDSATKYACKQSATTLQYNLLSGSTWSTSPADNNRYVVSWIVATNEINAPVIAILGQEQYSSIGTAEAVKFGSLTLTNFPIVEFRPLWKVIFQTSTGFTNTPNALIANVLDLRQLSETGEAGTIVSDHGLLTGLADDDHSQYLHTTLTRAGITANISTTGNLGGANLTLTGELRGPSTLVIDPATVGDDTGLVRIKGDLEVLGATTNINSTTLVIEDKNIILGDTSSPTDSSADGGGITLKGTTDKTFAWLDATDAWTSSERISIPLGSAGAPSLTFTGDSNTGIYSPGADQVAISTGGSGRLFVDASGRIGLGAAIDAGYVATIGGALLVKQSTDTNGYLTIQGSNSYLTTSNNLIVSTNSAERLRITSAGLVGVGTSSPAGRLHVFGGDSIFGATSYTRILNADRVIDFTNTAQDTYVAGRINGLSLKIYGNNGNGIDIDSSGRVGVGTNSPDNILTVIGTGTSSAVLRVGNGTSFTGGTNFLIPHLAVNSGSDTAGNVTRFALIVGSGGQTYIESLMENASTSSASTIFRNRGTDGVAERMRITSIGRVGIGTNTPNALLHVNGNAMVGAADANDCGIDVGMGATGSRSAYVDLIGDTTFTDFGLRIIRENTGANTNSGIYHRGTGSLVFNAVESGPFLFFHNNTERVRIDSSGRLLVGTSSVSGTNTLFESSSTTANAANIALVKRNSGTADQSGQQLHFYNFGPANTARSADVEVGSMCFYGSQPTSGAAQEMARITCAADLLQTGLNTSGRLSFSTTVNGGSLTERLRITSDGNIGIGTTNPAHRLDVAGNIRLGGQLATAATATPAYLSLGTSFSSTPTRANCKIRLYDNGADVYGFNIGVSGDVQYHSTTTHQFYNSDVATLLVNNTAPYYKGSTIWHAGNDGVGSGLDADLLDGINSSLFVYDRGANLIGATSSWDVVEPGMYGVASASSFTGTNNPSSALPGIYSYGVLSVFESNGNGIVQLYAPHTGNKIALRTGWDSSNWYGWQQIWTNTSDGAGSGLDADLLDGLNSTSFVRSDADTNLSGIYAFTSTSISNAKLTISGHGGASSYNYLLNASNDTGVKAVHFVNGSTRSADGGPNTYTIRNDGGSLRLGQGSFSTLLEGSALTYNSNTVWHAGNDGSGSGLDADLLDGNNSSYFLNTSSSSQTKSGNLRVTAVSESWAEGVSVSVPSAGNWGGYRLRRERGGDDGNWAFGYTALDSTDDLVFISNNSGVQVNNILRLTKTSRVGINNATPLQNLDVRGNFLLAADGTTATHITQKPYTINNGTLSWEGSAGQLFSITNNLTSGSIFSVNDVSGIPSIDVDANGTIELAPFGGNVGVGTTNPTTKLHVIGDILASGNVTAYSDSQLKDNVETIDKPLEKVLGLRGVTFTRVDTEDRDKKHVGVIAQEVEAVLPEVVQEHANGIKSVAYGNMVGLLIEAIKEQQSQIESLKAEIESLKRG